MQHMLMEVVVPHHDPERVELPQGVLGFSRAAAAFAAGAGCALAAVAPAWAAACRAAWRATSAGTGAAA
jgi:hypothetical protein